MPQMSNMPWTSMFVLMNMILLMIETNSHFSKKKKW